MSVHVSSSGPFSSSSPLASLSSSSSTGFGFQGNNTAEIVPYNVLDTVDFTMLLALSLLVIACLACMCCMLFGCAFPQVTEKLRCGKGNLFWCCCACCCQKTVLRMESQVLPTHDEEDHVIEFDTFIEEDQYMESLAKKNFQKVPLPTKKHDVGSESNVFTIEDNDDSSSSSSSSSTTTAAATTITTTSSPVEEEEPQQQKKKDKKQKTKQKKKKEEIIQYTEPEVVARINEDKEEKEKETETETETETEIKTEEEQAHQQDRSDKSESADIIIQVSSAST